MKKLLREFHGETSREILGMQCFKISRKMNRKITGETQEITLAKLQAGFFLRK